MDEEESHDSTPFVVTIPSLKIPHKRARIGFRWGVGNELAFFVTPSQPKNQPTAQKLQVGSDSNVYVMRWDILPDEMSKLVNESHGVFVHLQQRAQHVQNEERHSLILECSRHYRACLRAQILAVRQRCNTLKGNVSAETLCEELKQWGRLCALIEMLWHLSEILLFSKSNHNVLLTLPLVDWLNYHFPLTLPDLDVISSTTKPEEHPDYWTLFFRLLLYGRTTECRDLLRQHSQYVEMTSTNTAHNPFIILDILLEVIPTLELTHYTLEETFMKWKEWHDDIERLSVSPLVMSWSPELKRVLNVLRGDNKTLADITNTWYELLVAKFLFQDPRITTKAFYTHTSTGSALVDECLTLKQMGYVATRQRDDDVIHSSLINEILLHIFTTDVRLLVKKLNEVGNTWLMAHFFDLLVKNNSLTLFPLRSGVDEREYYLLEYASSLMSNTRGSDKCYAQHPHPGYLTVAADYLFHAPILGKSHLELYVRHTEKRTDRAAQNMLDLCTRYHLNTDIAQCIAREMAQCALRQNNLVRATYWLVESVLNTSSLGSFPTTTLSSRTLPNTTLALLHHIVRLQLHSLMRISPSPASDEVHSLSTSESKYDDLQSKSTTRIGLSLPLFYSLLPSSIVHQLSPTLSFLRLYYEFCVQRESGEYQLAAKTLFNILTSHIAPSTYLSHLFCNDLLSLLTTALSSTSPSSLSSSSSSSSPPPPSLTLSLPFSVHDTYQLMQCFEEWRLQRSSMSSLASPLLVDRVNFALVRYLGLAIREEGGERSSSHSSGLTQTSSTTSSLLSFRPTVPPFASSSSSFTPLT